jgi:hypothetical protein
MCRAGPDKQLPLRSNEMTGMAVWALGELLARTIPDARTHRSFCPRWTKLGSARVRVR